MRLGRPHRRGNCNGAWVCIDAVGQPSCAYDGANRSKTALSERCGHLKEVWLDGWVGLGGSVLQITPPPPSRILGHYTPVTGGP